jgi:hypothetical protein
VGELYRKAIDTKLFWLLFMGIASAILTSIFSGVIISLSLKGIRETKKQNRGKRNGIARKS